MKHDRQILDHSLRKRAEWAESLCFALGECDPGDAAQICAAFLDQQAAGMPRLDMWGDLRADAHFWADTAHPAELEQYACTALRKLGDMALGKAMRKRLFVSIWNSFSAEDRRAFMGRIDADGNFQKDAG